MKVSVIIPVYNTELYMRECLQCLVEQTLRDIEIICVNDGSTDHSLEIIHEFQNRDSRISVYTQENLGNYAARNTGMQHAKGEYYYFLDSDDLIERNALEVLYNKAKEDDLDILYFNTTVKIEEGMDDPANFKTYYIRNADYPGIYRGIDLVCSMMGNHDFKVAVWSQFYKANFLRDNRLMFDSAARAHADNLFSFTAGILSKRSRYLEQELHCRRVRKDSIMTAPKSMKNVMGYIRSYVGCMCFCEEHAIYNKNITIWLNQLYVTGKGIYKNLPRDEKESYYHVKSASDEFIFSRV